MIKFLSSKNYEEGGNCGDCIVYIENGIAIIYDCGCEQHAKRVEKLLDNYGIKKAIVILSHNDDDHFKGIPYLIDKGRVEILFTTLLLMYKDDILDRIDDKRRNRDSVAKQILDLYDNISSLSGKVVLRDVYKHSYLLPHNINFIGPEYDYMIDAVAKRLDGREGDTIDGETIVNATSVQIKLTTGDIKLLLTGDCAPKAIPDSVNLNKFTHIQLPHHGKAELAEQIFDRIGNNNALTYIVSDNTGDSNGGSDNLKTRGRRVKNTKNDGDIDVEKMCAPVSTGKPLGL